MRSRIEVSRLQRALTTILLDEVERQRWEYDPVAYARSQLDTPAEAALIGGLDARDIALMAWRLRDKGALREETSRRRALRAKRDHTSDESHQAFARSPATTVKRAAKGGIAQPSQGRAIHASPSRQPRVSAIAVGLAYRPLLFRRLVPTLPPIDVWELTLDQFVPGGEVALGGMRSFAEAAPIVLHSIDLSVGSEAARHDERLARKGEILRASGVNLLSDHCAFSRVDGGSLPHFAPLWRLEEVLELVVGNVDYLQAELGLQLALENIALIFDPGGDIGTAEFLNEVAARTGCGIHLDITNMTINDANGYLDARNEFEALDLTRVLSCHLAGGEYRGSKYWDSHAFPVSESDLEWLKALAPRMPNCRSVVIERDSRQIGSEVVTDLERVRAAVAAKRCGSVTQAGAPLLVG